MKQYPVDSYSLEECVCPMYTQEGVLVMLMNSMPHAHSLSVRHTPANPNIYDYMFITYIYLDWVPFWPEGKGPGMCSYLVIDS